MKFLRRLWSFTFPDPPMWEDVAASYKTAAHNFQSAAETWAGNYGKALQLVELTKRERDESRREHMRTLEHIAECHRQVNRATMLMIEMARHNSALIQEVEILKCQEQSKST